MTAFAWWQDARSGQKMTRGVVLSNEWQQSLLETIFEVILSVYSPLCNIWLGLQPAGADALPIRYFWENFSRALNLNLSATPRRLFVE